MNNMALAKIGEDLAVSYLSEKKYQILARNVRYKEGEIDIVSKCDQVLVFVEVKTRKNINFGFAEESFNDLKRQRLLEAIQKYIYLNNYSGDWRVDLIAISLKGDKASLRHYISEII